MFDLEYAISFLLILALFPLFLLRGLHWLWTRVLFRDKDAADAVDSFYTDFKYLSSSILIRPNRIINLLDTLGQRNNTKPTILLCHGSCSRMGHFNRMIRHFHSEGYRVVAFDMLGCGRSTIPVGGDYSLPAHFEDLKAIIETYCKTPFYLIGHSAGANLALSLATDKDYSRNLRGVIALSPVGPSSYEKVTRQLHRSFALPYSLSWLIRPLIGLFVKNKMFATTAQDMVIRVAMEASARNPVHMYVNYYRGFKLSELTGKAIVPVLVMTGAEDGMTPAEGGREAAILLGGEMLEIPNAGHAVAEEAPDLVISHVERFLNK